MTTYKHDDYEHGDGISCLLCQQELRAEVERLQEEAGRALHIEDGSENTIQRLTKDLDVAVLQVHELRTALEMAHEGYCAHNCPASAHPDGVHESGCQDIRQVLRVADKQNHEPECTCSIDGTPYCKAKGTGYCKAENPSR